VECKGRTLIDYTVTNSKLYHFVLGTHVYRGSSIGSDHTFLISKPAVPQDGTDLELKNNVKVKKDWRYVFFKEDGVKQLYQTD
jgi:hypothetical protein